MALPLFTRVAEDDGTFVVMARRGREATTAGSPGPARPPSASCSVDSTGRIPDRRPAPGEQYRFHIDMDACIGCKCCVVACNEQNGNPAEINWRRVSDLEGGRFPLAQRAHFSMGCNHCADPTCLAGCPVDAYTKSPDTGIVHHSADTCIGCQYCTWTCSYGVPQFNPERGVVGKCDMCHGRLSQGQAPACVSACPEGAIGIEIVNIAEWRAAAMDTTRRAGLPAADGSLSTTRLSLSARVPALTPSIDRIEPAEAHAPLVVMTVLTQMGAGAFVAILLPMFTGPRGSATTVAAIVATAIVFVGLAASTLHLGRPIHAYRAMKMWRRSWLSREVVLLGAFAHAAAAFSAALWFNWPFAATLGVLTVVAGLAGVGASAFIYQVPSRPLWHSPATFVQFFMTAAWLGVLFACATTVGESTTWRTATLTIALTQLVATALIWRHVTRASSRELRGASLMLRTSLRRPAAARVILLVLGALIPALTAHPTAFAAALVLAAAGELVGRYLFFVAAVPRHMTASYIGIDKEAA